MQPVSKQKKLKTESRHLFYALKTIFCTPTLYLNVLLKYIFQTTKVEERLKLQHD